MLELATEVLSTVNDEVSFPIEAVANEVVEGVPTDTEVELANGKGTMLPFIETTVAMDVLVVTEMYVLVITDMDGTVPTLPTRVELVLSDGRGGKSRLRLDPLAVIEEFLVTKGTTGDDSEVVKKGTVPEADIAIEALVEKVFIKVKFVDSPLVVSGTLAGSDGLLVTSVIEVDVVVMMARVVTTDTKGFVLSVLEDMR